MPQVVKNEGSAARDHLANERTFLAWFRTALGLVGLGILLERLEVGATAGFALIGAGGLLLLYGVVRYLQVARHLSEGTFPIARRGPIAISIAAAMLAIAAAGYLLQG